MCVWDKHTPEMPQKTIVHRVKSLDHNPIHNSKYLHMDIGSITQIVLRIVTCIFRVSSTLRKDSFHTHMTTSSMRACKMKVYDIYIAKSIWIGKQKWKPQTDWCICHENRITPCPIYTICMKGHVITVCTCVNGNTITTHWNAKNIFSWNTMRSQHNILSCFYA